MPLPGRLLLAIGVTTLVAGGWGMEMKAGRDPMGDSNVDLLTVDVTEHGAVPDDGTDDTLAVLSAFEACRGAKASRLLFPPGRYDFHEAVNPENPRTSFPVHEFNNLIVEGRDSQLIFHGLVMPFVFGHCTSLHIRGLLFDWERPPFSVGTVVSATDTVFDVEVYEEFPLTEALPVQAFMDYDEKAGRPLDDAVDAYYAVARTELVGPQVLRVHLKRPVPVKEGATMVLRHQVYGFNAIGLYHCESVSIEDVTIYTCPGMGVYAQNSRDIRIERLTIRVRPGTRRLISATADGTHFNRCQGLVELRDCVFEGMGDDAGNFKGLYVTTLEMPNERAVLARHNLKIPNVPEVGDRMEFVRRETLLPYATGVVASVTPDAGEGRHGIVFESPLPAEFKLGDVLSNVTRIPRVRISGCTVRNNRARGFLIQTHDAVVEDCLFENCTFGGVYVLTEVVHFFESKGTRDVVLRNNRFLNCGYMKNVRESPITVFAYLANFQMPPFPGVHEDVVVEGNTIRGSNNSAIFVAGTRGFEIRNNTVTDACREPNREEGRSAIYVMSSSDGVVTDNCILPAEQGEGFREKLTLGPWCDEWSIEYEDPDAGTPSRSQQLAALRKKLILVPMWGWPVEEMAKAAKEFGYEVVSAPSGNNIANNKTQAKIYAEAGLQMVPRIWVPCTDVFDPDNVERACRQMTKVIEAYEGNPDVLGYAVPWGLYGEGGFPNEYVFSATAVEAFNREMGTPGETLPRMPGESIPGSLRWAQWMEFRSRALREFRRTYIKAANQVANKLVGTWSEFYPIENYPLNMGDAPGADFLFYDLSFGDVAVEQTRAFAETHGSMQHYETFEAWRDHEVPLIAKAAGEGVIPMGFQFPMRRGHHTDFLSPTTVFIDNIEDEYSLRIAPDIRQIVEAARGGVREREVALVYGSFAAGAYPGGKAHWFYQPAARQIEGMLHQMGVAMKAIPYEHLESLDLARYKLVIVPEAMYLNERMRANLKNAPRVLYTGDLLLTHRDPASATGDFETGWEGVTHFEGGALYYAKIPSAPLIPESEHPLMAGITLPRDVKYPSDQIVTYEPEPSPGEIAAQVGEHPAIISREEGRVVHVTNRLFCHAYHMEEEWLEEFSYTFLRNLLEDCEVTVRTAAPPAARVKGGSIYGSYGLSGALAWSSLEQDVKVTLTNGREITIPRCGWVRVGE